MAKILITGGTGMIGTALTKALVEKGYEVNILTRHAKSATSSIQYYAWNPATGEIDAKALEGVEAIVHLAGANVADGRWTAKRKKEIVDSRVQSGQLLVKALREIPNKVATVVSASAIGWYGPDPIVPNPSPFVETDAAATDFLGATCQQWERAIAPVAELGKRLVTFRIGIVLSKDGGAYAEFRKPLKFGLATVLGSGKQVISWIHIDDLVRLFVEAIHNNRFNGTYNAVANTPVSNRQLIKEMAAAKGFHITVPAPAAVLKLVLGEMSIEVLKSTTVSNEKIKATGFQFQYPDIKSAVKQLNGKS